MLVKNPKERITLSEVQMTPVRLLRCVLVWTHPSISCAALNVLQVMSHDWVTDEGSQPLEHIFHRKVQLKNLAVHATLVRCRQCFLTNTHKNPPLACIVLVHFHVTPTRTLVRVAV